MLSVNYLSVTNEPIMMSVIILSVVSPSYGLSIQEDGTSTEANFWDMRGLVKMAEKNISELNRFEVLKWLDGVIIVEKSRELPKKPQDYGSP
jgi:hypothetical protein